jgi:hypothetical protein
MPAADKALATTERMFRQFPVTNDVIKAVAVARAGTWTDGSDRPVHEVGKRGVVAALLGLQTTDSINISRMSEQMFGRYQELTEEGILDAVKRQARDDVRDLYRPALMAPAGSRERSYEEVVEFINDNLVRWRVTMGDQTARQYAGFVQSELLRIPEFKDKVLTENIRRWTRTNRIAPDENITEYLRRFPIPGVEELIKDIETRYEFREALSDFFEE